MPEVPTGFTEEDARRIGQAIPRVEHALGSQRPPKRVLPILRDSIVRPIQVTSNTTDGLRYPARWLSYDSPNDEFDAGNTVWLRHTDEHVPLHVNETYLALEYGAHQDLPVFVTDGTPAPFLARLTDRDYPTDGSPYALYSWTRVLDSNSPNPLTYTDATEGPFLTGGPGNFPVIHLRDVDLPLRDVYWIRRGRLDYFLVDADTRCDFIVLSGGTPDECGLMTATLYRWNHTLCTREERGLVLGADAGMPGSGA